MLPENIFGPGKCFKITFILREKNLLLFFSWLLSLIWSYTYYDTGLEKLCIVNASISKYLKMHDNDLVQNLKMTWKPKIFVKRLLRFLNCLETNIIYCETAIEKLLYMRAYILKLISKCFKINRKVMTFSITTCFWSFLES